MIPAKKFQTQVLTWFDQHGRKDLPWQKSKTPYRVWLSEIMLQQTQVATVIPYFKRFLKTFPTMNALANATQDEVLHLWTGLGYYSRARNLHRTAKMIMENFHGKMPDNLEALQSLPGIGQSTAGAILAIAFSQPATILDGNVKRVFTRFCGITEWPGEKETELTLWKIAADYTPTQRIADYTQAMMDLGATICTRGTPLCHQCPLIKNCVAHKLNIAKELPKTKPKKELPIRETLFLILQHQHRVLLMKRPAPGIWGGLWSFPECSDIIGKKIRDYCRQQFQLEIDTVEFDSSFRHTFSHFHLNITPAYISLKKVPTKIMDSDQQIWYNLKQSPNIGLPSPTKKILKELAT